METKIKPVYDVAELFKNTQIKNNHGEVRQSSSSANPFNEMFEGLFSHPQKNTSPEERVADESSPDYFSSHAVAKERDALLTEKYFEKRYNDSALSRNDQSNNVKDRHTVSIFKTQADDTEETQTDNNSDVTTDNKPEVKQETVSNNSKQEKTNAGLENDNTEKVTTDNASGAVQNNTDKTDNEVETEATKVTEAAKAEDPIQELDPEMQKEVKSFFKDLLSIIKKLLLNKNENVSEDMENLKTKLDALLKKLGGESGLSDFLKDIKNLLGENGDLFKQKVTDLIDKVLPKTEKKDNEKGKPDNILIQIFKENKTSVEEAIKEWSLNEDATGKDLASRLLEILNKNSDPSVKEDSFKDIIKDIIPEQVFQKASNVETDIIPQITQPQVKDSSPLFDNQDPNSMNQDTASDKKENNTPREILAAKKDILNSIKTDIKTENEPVAAEVKKEAPVIAETVKIQNTNAVQTDVKVMAPQSSTPVETTIKQEQTAHLGMEKVLQEAKANNEASQVKSDARFPSYLSKAFEAEKQIMERIISQANLKLTPKTSEINFLLNPPELGNVKISLIEENGVLTGKIRVQSDAIKEIVEANITQLKHSLNQNMKVEKIEIEVRDPGAENKNANPFKEQGDFSGSDKKEHGKASQNNDYYEETDYSYIRIPSPKGVNINENGLVTVDLIG